MFPFMFPAVQISINLLNIEHILFGMTTENMTFKESYIFKIYISSSTNFLKLIGMQIWSTLEQQLKWKMLSLSSL